MIGVAGTIVSRPWMWKTPSTSGSSDHRHDLATTRGRVVRLEGPGGDRELDRRLVGVAGCGAILGHAAGEDGSHEDEGRDGRSAMHDGRV